MNAWKSAVNAVANLVYKTISKRGKDDAPDHGKLNAYLRRMGWKTEHLNRISSKAKNAEQGEHIMGVLRAMEQEKKK